MPGPIKHGSITGEVPERPNASDPNEGAIVEQEALFDNAAEREEHCPETFTVKEPVPDDKSRVRGHVTD
jgi:hypothetical protein